MSKEPDLMSVLDEKLFTPHFRHSIIIICGLIAGISTGITIEYHTLFEQNRDVPWWETIFVASLTTALTSWFCMFALHLVNKLRS